MSAGPRIAITGASGRLGREVAQALAERVPARQVTLGTRNPEAIRAYAEQGFRTRILDFDQPESMQAAFDGADVVFIICGDAPNELRMAQHRRAIDAAVRAGVGRVVYTSFVNPQRSSLFPYARVHEDSESHLRRSGATYTLLRNNHYAENLEQALLRAWQGGTLALPGAGGKVAYLARRDVAAATAGALVQDGHDHRAYELTGSRALDLHEVAELASRVWGRRVVAEDMQTSAYRTLLRARGLPPFAVEAQIGIRLAAGAGEYAAVTDDASRLAGRPIESMDRYLERLHARQLQAPQQADR